MFLGQSAFIFALWIFTVITHLGLWCLYLQCNLFNPQNISCSEIHFVKTVTTSFLQLMLKWQIFLMLFVVVQSLSCVRLLVNSWTAACHTCPSFTISQSLLKLMSIELVMSYHAFAFNLFKSFSSNWFYYNQHIFTCCFFSSDNLWLLFNLLWPFAFNIIHMVKLKFTILLVIFIPFFVPFSPTCLWIIF